MKTLGTRRSLAADHMPRGGIVAEIGVWRGEFAADIYQYNQPAWLFLVDQWLHFEDPSNREVIRHSQEEIDDIYVGVCDMFCRFPNVTVMRGESTLMAGIFPDEFFDWIYIDASHEYEAIQRDLAEWARTVKVGGFMAGHDYVPHVGVVRAVGEFLEAHPKEWDFAFLAASDSPSFALERLA